MFRGRFCVPLVVALLTAGLPWVAAEAQTSSPVISKPGFWRWSDAGTWKGHPPRSGDVVRIPKGSHLVLDVPSPRLRGLNIVGSLRFGRRNLTLESDWIMVHGLLKVGSERDPFRHRAQIVLTEENPSTDVMGMGAGVFGVMGGRLELHGQRRVSWTRLARTADQGSTRLELKSTKGMRAGDDIVIASTDFSWDHAEQAQVTHVDGGSIRINHPLKYQHWGTLQTIAGATVDERAEVALLSRNIIIRSSRTAAEKTRGHVMVMGNSQAQIEGVEFKELGQAGVLSRYPVHFHLNGRNSKSYIRRSSIHHSSNRCVVLHDTSGVTVKQNVCFDHIGHGFFLETGGEVDNRLVGNLGLSTRSSSAGLLPSDAEAATFWVTNPDNVLRGNVAGGSAGHGFWYALPEHPIDGQPANNVWPRRTPLAAFDRNVAHSNHLRGLNVDRGPVPDGSTSVTHYTPVSDPSDRTSRPVVAEFRGFRAFMNRERGMWLRGKDHLVTGAVLSSNRIGATFASSQAFLSAATPYFSSVKSLFKDSVIVGTTGNRGNPGRSEPLGDGGYSLPTPDDPSASLLGFEFYDGQVGVENVSFARFQSDRQRRAGALSYLASNGFSIHPGNYAQGTSFVNANPVYLSGPQPKNDGDVSQVFVDRDGSVTGKPGAKVVGNIPFLLSPTCEFAAEWNAHICTGGEYATLYLQVGEADATSIKPVVLTRADDRTQSLYGPNEESTQASTTILQDRAYAVSFQRGTPSKAAFSIVRSRGWIRLDLPVSRPYAVSSGGSQAARYEDLRSLMNSDKSGYYYDESASMLYLRLRGGDDGHAEISISAE